MEGLEREVLEGAHKLLSAKKVDAIIFEISTGVMDRLNRDPLEVIKKLETFGYKTKNSKGIAVSSTSHLDELGGQDLIAIPYS